MPSISQEDHDKIIEMYSILTDIKKSVFGNGQVGLVTRVNTLETNQKSCLETTKFNKIPDRLSKIETALETKKEVKSDWKFVLIQSLFIGAVLVDVGLRLFKL